MFISKVEKTLDIEKIGLKNSKKLEGQVILRKIGAPTVDMYVVHPDFYQYWKERKSNILINFQEELREILGDALQKYKTVTLRNCFVFYLDKKIMGAGQWLKAWRNLRMIEQVEGSIFEAYQQGERLIEMLEASEFKLGLLIMGRLNAERGGHANISTIETNPQCYLEACWGDPYLIAEGKHTDSTDTFVIQPSRIVKKEIKNKTVGYFFIDFERKLLPLNEKQKNGQCLTDEEILRFAGYAFKAANYLKTDVIMEFLITPEGVWDIYDLYCTSR